MGAGRRIAGTLLTAGIAVGAWYGADAIWGGPETATYAHTSDKSVAETAAHTSLNFWAKHIGKPLTTKVMSLEGYDTFTCGPDVITSVSEPVYCAPENTVVIPARVINELRNEHSYSKVEGDAAIKGWMRVATAGVVQAELPGIMANAPKTGENTDLYYPEYQRACLAGIETVNSPSGDAETGVIYQSMMHSNDSPSGADHRLIAENYANGYRDAFQKPVDPNLCADLRMTFDVPSPPR